MTVILTTPSPRVSWYHGHQDQAHGEHGMWTNLAVVTRSVSNQGWRSDEAR